MNRRPYRDCGIQVALALVSGGMLAMALCGRDTFWAAWVAFVPLLTAMRGATAKRAFLLAFITGFIQSAGILYWLPNTVHLMTGSTTLGYAFVAGNAILWGLCLATGMASAQWTLSAADAPWAPVRKGLLSLVTTPLFIVTFEYIYTIIASGIRSVHLPLAGYSQWNHPRIIQIAAYTGVFGISFIIVFVNVCIAAAISRRAWQPAAAAALLLAACLTFGTMRMRQPHADGPPASLRVALLQGNIKPWDKLDARKGDLLARHYLNLNRRAAKLNPELVVWTEAALPWPLEQGDDLVAAALAITRPLNAYHIVGAPQRVTTGEGGFLNTAFLVAPNGQVPATYHKTRMLAFVETPVRIPGTSRALRLHPATAGYMAGREHRVLHAPPADIGVRICNENFYADLARQSAAKGAEFIVNLSNDGWMPADTALRQHFLVNVLRAVETERDVVVANNVGISAFVDAYGLIRNRTGIRVEQVMAGRVTRRSGNTFYVKHGDVFALLCASLSVLFSALGLHRPRPTAVAPSQPNV